MLIAWVWSAAPNDWAVQLSAVFAGTSTLFTGLYVWFTYRLMKATAETARIAFEDARQQRTARMVPIEIAIRTLRDEMADLKRGGAEGRSDAMRRLTVLRQAMRDLSIYEAVTLTISAEVHARVTKLGHALATLTRFLMEHPSGVQRDERSLLEAAVAAVEAAIVELDAALVMT